MTKWVYPDDGILALKKDIRTPATTWMDLENSTVSEISPSQEDNTVRLQKVPRATVFIETECRTAGAVRVNGDSVSVREDGTFWRWMVETVAQQCECA